jgi:two-component system chemotaxis response regulator CheY
MTVRVLAIDDSRTIRNLVTKVLVDAGFTCETAEDGVKGLERFPEVDPDVVITDINMPNLDGFGVIEAIRCGSFNNNVPILVLTTEVADALKDRARKAGATGWLVKPFDDVAIVQVIRQVTGVVS